MEELDLVLGVVLIYIYITLSGIFLEKMFWICHSRCNFGGFEARFQIEENAWRKRSFVDVFFWCFWALWAPISSSWTVSPEKQDSIVFTVNSWSVGWSCPTFSRDTRCKLNPKIRGPSAPSKISRIPVQNGKNPRVVVSVFLKVRSTRQQNNKWRSNRRYCQSNQAHQIEEMTCILFVFLALKGLAISLIWKLSAKQPVPTPCSYPWLHLQSFALNHACTKQTFPVGSGYLSIYLSIY